MIQKENHLQYFFYRHKRIFVHFFVSSFLFNWLFKKIFGIFHIIKCIFSLQFVRKVPASTLFLANKLSINMRHLRSPRVSLLEENVKEKCDYIFLHKRIEKFFYWGWSFYSMKIEHISSQWVFNAWKKKIVWSTCIETYKIIKTVKKFSWSSKKIIFIFKTRHAHVDTQTINVDSNNWIENSNIIFFYASGSMYVPHVFTTWIETVEIPQFDIQHYCSRRIRRIRRLCVIGIIVNCIIPCT